MEGAGKTLMILGAVVFVVGLLFAMVPGLGRLPGDFSWRGDSWRVHMPLATSLLLSVPLTLGLWVFNWFASRGGK